MRTAIRSIVAAFLFGLVLAGGSGFAAHQTATAYTPRVIMIDNDGTFTPGDEGTGMWGYSPAHLSILQGEPIVFDNPASNFRPHNVVSITYSGDAFARVLESGSRFNSSPTRETLVTPGNSWTLDTTDLGPGHYLYYCSLHPWMLGTFTVTPNP